jgi:hypothetical protein
MNNKSIVGVLVALTLFVFTSGSAFAQSGQIELSKPGILPGSPFHFLDRIGETFEEFFTFGAEGKARLQVEFAAERVAEAQGLLTNDTPNIRAVEWIFARIELHGAKAADILAELSIDEDAELLATEILAGFGDLEDILDDTVDAAEDELERMAAAEAATLTQKLSELEFKNALEGTLKKIAGEIDKEVGKLLEGFTVLEDEFNVDIDDDTYSATYRAEADEALDLATLRDRILAKTGDWESGDVEFDDDSLDITFEKEYAPVTIDGIELFPEASVTISATVHSPERGMTSINYDVDITFETRSEHLADLLEEEMEDVEDELDKLDEEAEKQLEAEEVAMKAIKEAEEKKQELARELADENIALPSGIFAAFDRLLAEAKSALTSGNFDRAKQLARQVGQNLEEVEETIEDLEEAKEKEEKLKEVRKEKERELQKKQDKQSKRKLEKEIEALKEKQEATREDEDEATEQLRDIAKPTRPQINNDELENE